MPELIPQYVIQQAHTGRNYHSFAATALFVDLSGFSAITSALMVHGSEAAELMATIMEAIFTPLVDAVYEHDGFITTFAGDAFTAVFPHQASDAQTASQHALVAAMAIRQHFLDNPTYQTVYGRFAFTAKVGLGLGQVNCGIIHPADETAQTDGKTAYYFNGSAIEHAIEAESVAAGGQIIFDTAVTTLLAPACQTEPLAQSPDHARFEATHALLPPGNTLPPLASAADQRPFVPDIIWPHIHQGDFRQVITVFLKLYQAETHGQLTAFMHILSALQTQYGGYLTTLEFGDKGCTLLLYWGTPISYENDLNRTLSFLMELNEQSPLPFSAGVTYHHMYTGLTGSARRATFSCYGNGVNLAARLMAAAPVGAIWLEETAARRVSHSFVLTDVGAHQFKGFAEPIAVYAVHGRRAASQEELYQGQTIGRRRERQQLQQFLQTLLTAPQNQPNRLTAVVGEAGLGKSRLVYETVSQTARALSAQYWVAQTDEILHQPFNPFQYWLRHYFRQGSDQSEAENKRAFNQQLDQLIATIADTADAEALTRLTSTLGALVDLQWPNSLYAELDPQGRHENSLIALQLLVRAECQRQPFILVVEDAHMLDGSSQELLLELDRNLHDLPFAIILTSRPKQDRQWPLDTIPHQRLNLFALANEEIVHMCQAVLDAPADGLLQELIVSRAEGNPFFAEQILRYLQENGAIQKVDGVWCLLQAEQTSKLPDDLRLLFIARLDRLEQSVREAVEMAAVLGREFDVRLLGRMLQDKRHMPHTLVQAENEAIWLSLSQIRYMFRHLLLRDAAYEMQLLARRRQLHWLAATSLETVYQADLAPYYAEIAYHYETAVKQGLRDAHAPAITYLRLAGEQAAARYENRAAIDAFSRALALEETAVGQIELLLLREDIYHLVADRVAQQQDLQQLELLVEAGRLPKQAAVVALRQARLAEHQNDLQGALALAATAVALLQHVADPVLESAVHIRWGHVLDEMGDFNEARLHYQEALQLARQGGAIAQETAALIGLGATAAQQTDVKTAKNCWQQALVLAQQLGDHRQEASIFNNLGNIALLLNEYDNVSVYYQQALLLRQMIGDRSGEVTTLDNLGNMYRTIGQFEAARQSYEKALTILDSIGRKSDTSSIYVGLGLLAKSMGDYDAARSYYAEVLTISTEIGRRVLIGAAHHNLGALAKVYGDYAYATEQGQIALAIFQEVGDRYGEWLTLHELGDVAVALGDYAAGQQQYEQALAIQQQIEYKKGMALTWTKLGALLVKQGRWAEAEARLQPALAAHRQFQSQELVWQTQALLADCYTAQGATAVAYDYISSWLPVLLDEAPLWDYASLYVTAYQLLEAMGRVEEAAVLLQRAQTAVVNWSHNIKEAQTRRMFLHQVPLHQRILNARIAPQS